MHEGKNVRAYALGRLAGAAATAIIVALLVSGCVKTQAKTVPQVPLDMPAPPPRVVEITDPASPPIVSLPEEPVRNTLRPPPAPPQRTDVRPPEPKPDVPAEAPKVDDIKPPATTLQAAPTQQESEAERKIRVVLAQTNAELNRINVRSLNIDARQQLEMARGFVRQAEDAVRSKNLVFATNLAEKAAALAAQLASR